MIQVFGAGLSANGQLLNNDVTIVGFTAIPLPGSLPLLLAALGVAALARRRCLI